MEASRGLDLNSIVESLRQSPFYSVMSNDEAIALITWGIINQAIIYEKGNPDGVSEEDLAERISRLKAAQELLPTLEEIEERYFAGAVAELAKYRLLLLLGEAVQ